MCPKRIINAICFIIILGTSSAMAAYLGVFTQKSEVKHYNSPVYDLGYIIFSKADYQYMMKTYELYPENEFEFCFNRQDEHNRFKLSTGHIIESNRTSVTAECSDAVQLEIHTHPEYYPKVSLPGFNDLTCSFSQGDMEVLNQSRFMDFMGIICTDKQIVIMDKSHEKINIIVED